MTKALVAVAIVALAATQQPRALPNTEVYLAGMQFDVSPQTGADRDSLINTSNNPGYDNQPSFTPDGKALLFTSNRDGKQTDIYRFDIEMKALTQLTHTPESEYSPLVTPDGKSFSVIRVEADGIQRLWKFDLDGSNPRLVLENVRGVGYHAWLDATHLAVFIVGANGQPSTLQLADTATDTAEVIDSNPGHGLALRPHRGGLPTLTYVCKTDASHWVVKEFDLATRKTTAIADAIQGSEDLAWDPHYDRLLMPKGSQVFVLATRPGDWRADGDFASAGVDRITRLVIKADPMPGPGPRLAFVAEPVSK